MSNDLLRRPSSIRTVTASTFPSEILAADGRIAVEFMSYGCGHCRALEPVLEQVAASVGPSEKVFRVNVAVEQDLAEQYGITGTPTLVMFSHAREVGRVEGPRPTVASVKSALTRPFES